MMCSLVMIHRTVRAIKSGGWTVHIFRWMQPRIQSGDTTRNVFQNLVPKLQAKRLNLFVHSAVFLTIGPYPLPKRVLHIVRASASSFNSQCPLLSLSLSSSCLQLLPRLTVTAILPSSFSSITCFRRQFLCKMWPIRVAFIFAVCRIFLSSLSLFDTYSFLTRSVQLIFSILLQHHILKLFRYFWSNSRSLQVSVPYKAMLQT
jgi:hypothetical protein